jgi:8-oxo-dGTP diphosphatase
MQQIPDPSLPLLIVAAALIDGAGQILVQQRPQGGAMAGLWEFPGGKIEAGETPEAALVRELFEELDLIVAEENIHPACFASAPNGARHMILMLYTCRKWAGIPVLNHASAMAWHRPDALRGLAMPPADIPFIDYLEHYVSD